MILAARFSIHEPSPFIPLPSWEGEEKFLGDAPSAPARRAKPLWTPQADVTLIYASEY